MSATDELRARLDERGVEYRTHGTTDRTWFEVGGISWFVIERENGSLAADAVLLTPEQAIAATLGSCNCSNSERTSGTCEYCTNGKFDGQTVMMSNHGWQRINFRPNCGRKVVGE